MVMATRQEQLPQVAGIDIEAANLPPFLECHRRLLLNKWKSDVPPNRGLYMRCTDEKFLEVRPTNSTKWLAVNNSWTEVNINRDSWVDSLKAGIIHFECRINRRPPKPENNFAVCMADASNLLGLRVTKLTKDRVELIFDVKKSFGLYLELANYFAIESSTLDNWQNLKNRRYPLEQGEIRFVVDGKSKSRDKYGTIKCSHQPQWKVSIESSFDAIEVDMHNSWFKVIEHDAEEATVVDESESDDTTSANSQMDISITSHKTEAQNEIPTTDRVLRSHTAGRAGNLTASGPGNTAASGRHNSAASGSDNLIGRGRANMSANGPGNLGPCGIGNHPARRVDAIRRPPPPPPTRSQMLWESLSGRVEFLDLKRVLDSMQRISYQRYRTRTIDGLVPDMTERMWEAVNAMAVVMQKTIDDHLKE